ncbi:MAG: mucoidy inhibitor MuiA family protein [Hyphomicrobiaceae bacterium]
MRGVCLAAAVLTAAAPPAMAGEIGASSQISAVTVFPSGAEVYRSATVKVPKGEQTLIFNNLPPMTVPGSVRVEGKSTGGLEIGSVDTRRVLVPHGDPEAQASERRRIEELIEKLQDEAEMIRADVEAAEAQKKFIQRLADLPANPPPSNGQAGGGMPDWGQIFNLVGSRLADAERAQLAARVKLRDVERRIDDQKKKLAQLAPVQAQRTEVKVFVAADADVEASLAIRYQVSNASWRPYYDARLDTGALDGKPKLSLVRRASIQQRSGEDWDNVALKLSTTRPGSGTAAPELYTETVDFESDKPRPEPVAKMGQVRSMARLRTADAALAAAPAAEMADARERMARVEAAAFQAIFEVPGKVTVAGTGEQKRVKLDATDLDPELIVRTTPRLEARAYLYAKFANPGLTPYLPGQISLFRDGTFVGTGQLPQLTPGEKHELGFGADDAVRVRHNLVEDKRGERGIIATSKTDVRTWQITVTNGHTQSIQLSVIDQVPVSKNDDIKVETVSRPDPTRRDVENRRGILAWDVKLAPKAEWKLQHSYRVTWPSAKQIEYGWRRN